MKHWKCQLTQTSLDLLQQRTGLDKLQNNVELSAPPDTPATHIRERAIDAIVLLVQQEKPELTKDQLGELRQALEVQCGEVDTR